MTTRLRILSAACVVALGLAGCGGDDPKPAAGTPANPLVAAPEAATNEAPQQPAAGEEAPIGYQKLVEDQSAKPQRKFTPCNLVTKAQARAILGTALLDPVEAVQGPTCIYRGERGGAFVGLAVQSASFDRLRRQVRGERVLDVAGRDAICGTHGQPTLYARLSADRVLSVTAPCSVAAKFALTAVREL